MVEFITGTGHPVEELELYDLKQDPFEKKNVADERPKSLNGLGEIT